MVSILNSSTALARKNSRARLIRRYNSSRVDFFALGMFDTSLRTFFWLDSNCLISR